MISNPATQAPTNGRRWNAPDALPKDSQTETGDLPYRLTAAAEGWIGDHPVLCVSAAITVGVVLGCLIKRR